MGVTANNNGVFGDATGNSNGLFGRTANGNGLVAQATGSGNAATFLGNVVVTGNLQVFGALKNVVIPFADGSLHRMYATEAPDNWFEDYGEAQITNGRASVRIAPDFLQTVNTTVPYFVFPVSHTFDIEGLAVTVRAADHFEIEANGKGRVDGSFAYRIVAKRKDVAAPRFERVPQITLPTAPAADALVRPVEIPKLPALPELTPEQREIPSVAPAPAPPGRSATTP